MSSSSFSSRDPPSCVIVEGTREHFSDKDALVEPLNETSTCNASKIESREALPEGFPDLRTTEALQYGESSLNFLNEGSQPNPSPPSQPMEAIHCTPPPPFLTKTYDMVEDATTNSIVSWSSGNNSFIVWNMTEFSQSLLPRYFKHNNLSSFVRQLNTYGFKKVNPDRMEFAHEAFLRGQKQRLKEIRRRKSAGQVLEQSCELLQHTSTEPCVEVGKFGLKGELERLKRDKSILAAQVIRLKQHQQALEQQARAFSERIQAAEKREEQMMNFLAKAIKSRAFLIHLKQQSEIFRLNYEAKERRRLLSSVAELKKQVEVNLKMEPQGSLEIGNGSRDIEEGLRGLEKQEQMALLEQSGASEQQTTQHSGCMISQAMDVETESTLSPGVTPGSLEESDIFDNVSLEYDQVDCSRACPLLLPYEDGASDLDLPFDLNDLLEEPIPEVDNAASGTDALSDISGGNANHNVQETGITSTSSNALAGEDQIVARFVSEIDGFSKDFHSTA